MSVRWILQYLNVTTSVNGLDGNALYQEMCLSSLSISANNLESS